MHSQWSYQRRYPISTGLRPNLQLELTLRAPMLDIASVPIYALADRLAGKDGAPFEVKTISVAETLAEKVLSFLRRFAQHRSGQMRGVLCPCRSLREKHHRPASRPRSKRHAGSGQALAGKRTSCRHAQSDQLRNSYPGCSGRTETRGGTGTVTGNAQARTKAGTRYGLGTLIFSANSDSSAWLDS